MSDKIEWLPILLELGEDIVARILDSSPDAASAILAARAELAGAKKENEELKKLGHE